MTYGFYVLIGVLVCIFILFIYQHYADKHKDAVYTFTIHSWIGTADIANHKILEGYGFSFDIKYNYDQTIKSVTYYVRCNEYQFKDIQAKLKKHNIK